MLVVISPSWLFASGRSFPWLATPPRSHRLSYSLNMYEYGTQPFFRSFYNKHLVPTKWKNWVLLLVVYFVYFRPTNSVGLKCFMIWETCSIVVVSLGSVRIVDLSRNFLVHWMKHWRMEPSDIFPLLFFQKTSYGFLLRPQFITILELHHNDAG